MKKLNHKRLAEGEATGHFHGADEGTLYDMGNDVKLLDAPDGSEITHQEHNPVKLPPGKFVTGIVREYDHADEEARKVID